jgi:hypothetical protein
MITKRLLEAAAATAPVAGANILVEDIIAPTLWLAAAH